jgi:phenylalanyl-tRNA synthetase beta chain
MKVTLNWLREFVPIELAPAALCERLTLGGLSVDAVEERGAEIRGVVVAELVSTAPHPHADRLTLCQVRSGADGPVAVVCGATNMKAGDRVAYAAPGTTLPGGRRIEVATIRGIASFGMLCSPRELRLAEESEGILILPSDAPLGARLPAYLGIEDVVLDIDVTPNRGDCLSVLGIAREIAALTGTRLRRQRLGVHERGAPAGQSVTVRIDDPAGCGRYAARVVRGLRVAPSPPWMQQRLLAVGLRPINNVVDATNWVMIERGQPLHAFDFDRLPQPQIVVRRAGAARALRTLDGVERALQADDVLITTGAEPVAIAGIMGGAASEVTDATTTVLLESAWFDPGSVRRTARRLDLPSEAAYRFERGVDPAGVVAALDRVAALIERVAGGTVAPGVIDVFPGHQPPAPIHVRLRRVEEVLGVNVNRTEVTARLKALGANVSLGPKGSLAVVPPSFRSDLTREIDVIEEVARVGGYDRIPAVMPVVPLEGGRIPERMEGVRELKRVLLAQGLFEAVSVSFTAARLNEVFRGVNVPGRSVRLLNPMSRDEAELRRSLLGGLLAAWRLNASHGARGVAAFSVGKVFWDLSTSPGAAPATPGEGWRLAGVLAGEVPQRGLGEKRGVEFGDAKGTVELLLERLRLTDAARWQPLADESGTFHPGRSAVVEVGGANVGCVGALHPERETELDVRGPHWLFELDLDRVLAYRPPRLSYRELPRFPAVVRDVAVVVDEAFPSDRVIEFVTGRRHELIESVVMFDQYVGAPLPPGKKSLAYSVAYRAADRTLTDDEVNRVHAEVIGALTHALPVTLRQ